MEVALKMNAKEELLKRTQGEKIEAIMVEGRHFFSKPLFFDEEHIELALQYIEKWSIKHGRYPMLFAWTKSWVIFLYKEFENNAEGYDFVPRSPYSDSKVWSI